MNEKDNPNTHPIWGKMGEWVCWKQDSEWDSNLKEESVDEPCGEDETVYEVNVKGVMVYRIDVGNLSPEKAKLHVESVKENLKEALEAMKLDRIYSLFIPARNEPTSVKYIPLN